ncbi:hypothetical protein ACFULT_26480 [Rhodococcus sp. NPDC057297]|uniref:hypothetical protein n=1 Tax=Rhodococcus sp. NPDC057297 TaxID=3346090 RepID=UPI0036359F0D
MSLFKPAENVFDSLEQMCAFSSKDWSTEKEAAWLYGIVSGWDSDDPDDDPAMPELQARFGWNDEAVARLRRLREQWVTLAAAAAAEEDTNDRLSAAD